MANASVMKAGLRNASRTVHGDSLACALRGGRATPVTCSQRFPLHGVAYADEAEHREREGCGRHDRPVMAPASVAPMIAPTISGPAMPPDEPIMK